MTRTPPARVKVGDLPGPTQSTAPPPAPPSMARRVMDASIKIAITLDARGMNLNRRKRERGQPAPGS